MIYKALPQDILYNIDKIIETDDEEQISIIPLTIGEYSTDLENAQDICISLCDGHFSDKVRANAILGLSYLARRFGILSEKVVPYIIREYKQNEIFHEKIVSAIEDIELFTGRKMNI